MDWYHNGNNYVCLSPSDMAYLNLSPGNDLISKISGTIYSWLGNTYSLSTGITNLFLASDCKIYRSEDQYNEVLRNQSTGNYNPLYLIKDALARKFDIKGNQSLLCRRPDFWDNRILTIYPLAELPTPKLEDLKKIKIEALPGIDMEVDAIASDATSIATSSSMPSVSYFSEPQTFFEQGGSSSGGGKMVSSNTMDNITNGIGMAGTASSTYAGLRYTSYNWGGGYFRTANGKFYNMLVLELQSNGKFVRGVQGFRNGMMVAEKASAMPRVIGNVGGWLLTTYSAYKFLNNRSIGNGITLGEGIVSLLSWEVGLGLTYIHSSIDYQNVMIQNQLQIINTVDDNNLSDWEKIGILNSTPSNPWGSCP